MHPEIVSVVDGLARAAADNPPGGQFQARRSNELPRWHTIALIGDK